MKTMISKILRGSVWLFAISVLTITGCVELDEIPPGILDPATYFNSQEDALSALTGAYAPQIAGAQKYYLKSWIIITDVGSDDMGDGFGGIQDTKRTGPVQV